MIEIHNMVNDYIKSKLEMRKTDLKVLQLKVDSTTAAAVIEVRIDEIHHLLENVFKCDRMEIQRPEVRTLGAKTGSDPERIKQARGSRNTYIGTNYIAQASAPLSPDLAEYYNDCAEDATWD
jgi:hypothetical protein